MASIPLSSCLIDTSFDLDEALTLPENLSQQITYSNSTIVADMPTALTTGDAVCAVCMEGFQSGIGGKKSHVGMSTMKLASPLCSPTATLVLSAAVTSPASCWALRKS